MSNLVQQLALHLQPRTEGIEGIKGTNMDAGQVAEANLIVTRRDIFSYSPEPP